MSYNLNNIYPKPTFSTVGQTNGTSAAVLGQRLTITSTATVQFAAFNERSDMIILDVQAAPTYCTFDGSTPSATNGHILTNGNAYTWSQAAAKAAKFVATTTANSIIFGSEFQS